MIEAAIGALSNAIRGGQWRGWLGGEWNEHDAAGKPLKWRWLKADFINAAIYGLTIFVMSGNWLLALASIAAMMAGATPGWGDYIGALGGWRNDRLKENRFLDPLVKPLLRWPFWWGFAGLALRGLWWGLCLAVPFWFYGHHAVAWGLVINSLLMPVAYHAACLWMRNRLDRAHGWQSAAWGLGELFYGAALWYPLGGL